MSGKARSIRFLSGLLIVGLVTGPGCSMIATQTRKEPPPVQPPTAADVMKALEIDSLLAQQQALEDIYLRATSSKGADPEAIAVRELAGSTLATVYSFQGDYLAATRVFPASLDKHAASEAALPDPRTFVARDAAEVIAAAAASRRIVIVNEAHHAAETRWLPLALLPRLRALGYRYLALEALSEEGADVARRGYVTRESGSYTNEPIYAEMVRAALRLGFRLVPYDDSDPTHGDALREATQADNLRSRVFRADPGAKVIVLAGYRHASKNDDADRGGSLATRLQRMTGLEPLSVDQTALLPGVGNAYPTLWRAFKPTVPTALVARDDVPWSLSPEHYDVTVLLPGAVERHGRPTWLSLGGLRSAYPIAGESCANDFPCVVEARHAGDGDDAIPADRFVLRSVRDRAELYLAPGEYRLSAFDDGHRRIGPVAAVRVVARRLPQR
jgi:hypothetical protein